MLVEVQDLHKCHSAPEGGRPLEILKGVNFRLQEGASVAILGPSGSGKSTFLNILGAMDHFDSGSVLVDGRNLANLGEKEMADFRRTSIGLVFQMHHLLPQCTVLENVLVPAMSGKRPDWKSLESRACELLDSLGLAHRLEHRPGELSGGERQRVAVARALILSPKLILADEPTGALDRQAAQNLSSVLLEMNRKHKVALITVTHSGELAASMQRTLELKDGKLVERA